MVGTWNLDSGLSLNNQVHVAANHVARWAVVTGEQSLLHASLAVLGNPTTNLGKVEMFYWVFLADLIDLTLSVSAQTSWE